MLPREFPHWDNVYKTFRRWSDQGKFEQMHDRLRAQWRGRAERDEPSVSGDLGFSIDPQFSAGWGQWLRRWQEGEGAKRSLIVDTLGLLLAVSISAASVQDRDAADDAVAHSKEKYPSLNTLFVDSAYAGKWAQRTASHALGRRSGDPRAKQ